MIDGRLRQPEQHAGLAAHTSEIIKQPLLDILLGLAVDLVDDLHQQVHQAIDDLMSPVKAERGGQAIANVRGMAPHIPDRFDTGTHAEFLKPFRGHPRQHVRRQRQFADGLELGQFLQQGFQTDTPRIPSQMRKTDLLLCHRRLATLGRVGAIVWRAKKAIQRSA